MQLLQIDSAITAGQSVSRQLTAAIVAQLKVGRPDLIVVQRDVAAVPVPQQSAALLAAKAAGVGGVGDDAQHDLAVTEEVLEEFLASDIVVIGAPMYNFSIPSQLKAWIDSLATAGKTFHYTGKGVEGLCGGKRVIIASARGGIYSPPSPRAAFDHQESFLQGFFGFLGITDLVFVRAEGVAMGAEPRQAALEAALAQAAALPPA